MKTFYKLGFIALILSFAACTDVVELEVPQTAPEIVITGQLSNTDSCYVRISTTAPYFSDEETTKISGARVSIWQGSTEVALLTESSLTAGYYSSDFKGSIGNLYHIEVLVEGNFPEKTLGTWVSVFDTLRDCPVVDSIRQATLSRSTTPQAFEEGEYALMYFGVIPNVRNYYRLKRTLNDSVFAKEIIVFDDEGVDGIYFGSGIFPPISIYGPFEEDEMEIELDTLVVRLESISRDFGDFLDLVNSQTQVGSPFDAPPALVVGNIHRKGDAEDYAFGYFNVVGSNTNGLRYMP
jgi:hypothetical protein